MCKLVDWFIFDIKEKLDSFALEHRGPTLTRLRKSCPVLDAILIWVLAGCTRNDKLELALKYKF